jgi:hypothetical protein
MGLFRLHKMPCGVKVQMRSRLRGLQTSKGSQAGVRDRELSPGNVCDSCYKPQCYAFWGIHWLLQGGVHPLPDSTALGSK